MNEKGNIRPSGCHVFIRPGVIILFILLLLVISYDGESQTPESGMQYRSPINIDEIKMIAPTSDCSDPILLLDSKGVHHVFWISEFHEGAVVSHGTLDPVNRSLSDIVHVNDVVRSFQANIAIAQKDDASIAVVWRDDINYIDAIYGATYNIDNKAFSRPVQIHVSPPSNSISPCPDVACSEDGRIWVGWVETIEGGGTMLYARGFNEDYSPSTDKIVLKESNDIYYSLSYGPVLDRSNDGEILMTCSYWDRQTNDDGIHIFHIDASSEVRMAGTIRSDRSISGQIFLHHGNGGKAHLYYSTTVPGRSNPSVFLTIIDSTGKVVSTSKVFDTDGERVLDIHTSNNGSKAMLLQSAGASRTYLISVASDQSDEFGEMVRIHELWGGQGYESGSLMITSDEIQIITMVHMDHQPIYQQFLFFTRIDSNDLTIRNNSFLVPGIVDDPSRSDGYCEVDTEGNVHVLFIDDRTYYPQVYYSMLEGGESPNGSQTLEILEYCINARPRLLIHPDGRLSAFWWRIVPEFFGNWNYSIVARTSSDRGLTWSTPVSFERGDLSWSWTDYSIQVADNGTVYLIITGSMSNSASSGPDNVGFIKVYLLDRNCQVIHETVLDSNSMGLDSKLVAQPQTFQMGSDLFILFSNSPQSMTVRTPASISSITIDEDLEQRGTFTQLWALPTDEFYGSDLHIDSDGRVWMVWTQRNDTAAPSTSLWVAEFDPHLRLFKTPFSIQDNRTETSIIGFYFPKIGASSTGLFVSTFVCKWTFSDFNQQWVGVGGVEMHFQGAGASNGIGWIDIELIGGITFPPIDSWSTHNYPDDIGIMSFPISLSSAMVEKTLPIVLTSFPDIPHSTHGEVLAFFPNGAPSVPEIVSPPKEGQILDPVVILAVTPSIDPDGDPITYRFHVNWNDGRESWTSPWTNSTALAFRWIDEGGYKWTLEFSDQIIILKVPWTGSFQAVGNTPFADAGGPYLGWEGEPVELNASASWDDTGIVQYDWDLDGDGTFEIASTEPSTTHTWLDDFAGVVKLKVTDVTGLSSHSSATVVIMNRPPVPNVEIIGELLEGNEVRFECTVEDASIQDTFIFFWGISGTDNLSGPSISYVFNDNGEYLISMKVIDDDNGIGHWETVLEITNVAPSIENIADITTWEDEEVTIDAVVNDAPMDNVTIEWMIDDLNIGFGRILKYTFEDPGDYRISLRALDKDGGLDTATINVTVKDRIESVILNEARDITQSTVDLTWTMSPEFGFKSYIVRISTNPEFEDPIEVQVSDRSTTMSHVQSLKPGTYYYVEVELQCDNGTSRSNTVTFHTRYKEVSVGSPWFGLWILIGVIIALLVAILYINMRKHQNLDP